MRAACAEVLYDVLTALGMQTDARDRGVHLCRRLDRYRLLQVLEHDRAHPCGRGGVPDRRASTAARSTARCSRPSRVRASRWSASYSTRWSSHEDGAIAVAVLWRKDIDRVGADMDDLDSIASLTRQIEGVQIGITMTEKADGTVRGFRAHDQGNGCLRDLQTGRRRRPCPCGRRELHLRHGRGKGRDAARSEGAVPCSRLSFRVSC